MIFKRVQCRIPAWPVERRARCEDPLCATRSRMFGNLRTLSVCRQAWDILITATVQDQETSSTEDVTAALVAMKKQSLWRWRLETSGGAAEVQRRESLLCHRRLGCVISLVFHRDTEQAPERRQDPGPTVRKTTGEYALGSPLIYRHSLGARAAEGSRQKMGQAAVGLPSSGNTISEPTISREMSS